MTCRKTLTSFISYSCNKYIWAGFELTTTTSLNTLNRHLGIQENYLEPPTPSHTHNAKFTVDLKSRNPPSHLSEKRPDQYLWLEPQVVKNFAIGNCTGDINGALTPLCSWQLTPWGNESHPSTWVSYRSGNTVSLKPPFKQLSKNFTVGNVTGDIHGAHPQYRD